MIQQSLSKRKKRNNDDYVSRETIYMMHSIFLHRLLTVLSANLRKLKPALEHVPSIAAVLDADLCAAQICAYKISEHNLYVRILCDSCLSFHRIKLFIYIMQLTMFIIIRPEPNSNIGCFTWNILSYMNRNNNWKMLHIKIKCIT